MTVYIYVLGLYLHKRIWTLWNVAPTVMGGIFGDTCKENDKKWWAPLWHFIICHFREAACIITSSACSVPPPCWNVSSLWVSSCLSTGVCETRMMMMELLLGLWYCIKSENLLVGQKLEWSKTEHVFYSFILFYFLFFDWVVV